MRKRRLPPLNALRGFEAAARHLSLTKAAAELHLTQGAISRQVKELEINLNAPLFRRFTRRIELTAEGERYFRVVEAVLDELETATQRFDRKDPRRTLTVSVLPTIATAWLMPRLHLLANIHPDIEVHILSSIEPVDLLSHQADLAVRVGRLPGRRYERIQPRIELCMVARWDGVHADRLFDDVLVPVCAPELLPQVAATPQDLVALPLIHTTTRPNAWPDWLRAHGVRTSVTPDPKLQFGHFFMALEAARQGRGIALVPDVVLGDLRTHRGLAVPFPSRVPSAGEYYLLVHESRRKDPYIEKFRSWILDLARELEGMVGNRPSRA